MRVVLAAACVALVAALGPAGAAPAPDPIVGTWALGGGTVVVTGSGERFRGVVREPLVLHQCPHGPGELMWTIVRTKTGYAGRHRSFGARPGCGLRVWLSANWRLSGRTLQVSVARFEGRWPRACGSSTVCFRFGRVGAAPGPAAPAGPAAPRTLVQALVTIAGAPDSGAAVLGDGYTRSSAVGRLVRTSSGATGSLLVIHTYADRSELVAATPVSVTRTSTGLTARLRVTRSEAAGCEEGSTGTIVLRGDTASLALCGATLRWSGPSVSTRVT